MGFKSTGSARVLLVHPRYSNFPSPYPPHGIAYIAAYLERGGHEVEVIDVKCAHHEIPSEEFLEHVRSLRPDVIGIYVNMALYRWVYKMVPLLRPHTNWLVAGGPQATILTDEVIEHGFDAAIMNEGEQTLTEFLEVLDGKKDLKDVAGLAYRDKSGVIRNNGFRTALSDLNALPFPAYHLFDLQAYYLGDGTVMPEARVLTSRDCPAKCTFCYLKAIPSDFRLRSPENIMEEIVWLNQSYGTSRIDFADDTFPSTEDRIDHLLDLMLDQNLGMSWSCTTRIDSVSPVRLEKMKKAGCDFIAFGVESGDDDSLRRLGKKIRSKEAYDTLRDCKEIGIHTRANFMFGYPWESTQSMDATLALMKDLQPHVNMFMPQGLFHPLPGTYLYRKYKDEYDLEDWWIHNKTFTDYLDADSQPFFRTHGYDDYGWNEFFDLPKEVVDRIKQAIRMIVHHNMKNGRSSVDQNFHLGLYYLSKLLYRVAPTLEPGVIKKLCDGRYFLKTKVKERIKSVVKDLTHRKSGELVPN